MLNYISVKNFAIIENIEVDFKKGMTALTGETGAGKSLLIDAIGLLLGDRATTNIVRTGSDKAIVEGVFVYSSKKIKETLNKLGINSENSELIIKRQITTSNNNVIKVNNQIVTLSQLKEITSLLADIHTQFDTHRLINPQTYIDIIDGFESDKTNKLVESYQEKLKTYKKELKELNILKNSNNDLIERLDLMKFQVEELESYNLDINEETDLMDKVEKMQNFDKIYQNLNEAIVLLESSSAIDNIFTASKRIENIKEYSESFNILNKRVSESYYELLDTFEELKSEADSLDFDPKLLDSYEERLNILTTLKRKYRKELPDLIDYLEKTKQDILNIDNFDEVIKAKDEDVKIAFDTVKSEALGLNKLRKETSLYIETELLKTLEELELKKTDFKIEFLNNIDTNHLNSFQFFSNGIDEVDFLITTNIGEPLKPLSKSASGGEMSRIMLGLKNLLVKSLELSLIIFDEIDSGVSGFVASQVAKKMKSISKSTQVICITHIPQVAALSDNHLFISKSVEEGRTRAHIKELLKDDRIQEIAQMISGDHVTISAIESARELLGN